MDFEKQFGPWVIVTGASSGLGHEFAEQLAQRGLNIVLTARSDEKLMIFAAELRAKYAIQTRVITLDLSEPGSVDVLYVRCADLDIGLVVSNAGATNMCKFMDLDLDETRANVQLNVCTHADLARYFGENILTKRGGRGGLLFMSSILAMQGTPYLSAYSASKSFIMNFAEALHYENKAFGMHVTTVAPGPLTTPMITILPRVEPLFRRSMLAVLKPNVVVTGALEALSKNKVMYIPGKSMQFHFGVLRRFFFRRSTNVNFWERFLKNYMKVLMSAPLLRKESSENS